jgi:C-terminal processing protease CtpA/Prc
LAGIIFERDERGTLVLDAMLPGSPAARAKALRTGDVLVDIDGMHVKCKPVAMIGPLMLGPTGSEVTLGFERTEPNGSIKVHSLLPRKRCSC